MTTAYIAHFRGGPVDGQRQQILAPLPELIVPGLADLPELVEPAIITWTNHRYKLIERFDGSETVILYYEHV